MKNYLSIFAHKVFDVLRPEPYVINVTKEKLESQIGEGAYAAAQLLNPQNYPLDWDKFSETFSASWSGTARSRSTQRSHRSHEQDISQASSDREIIEEGTSQHNNAPAIQVTNADKIVKYWPGKLSQFPHEVEADQIIIDKVLWKSTLDNPRVKGRILKDGHKAVDATKFYLDARTGEGEKGSDIGSAIKSAGISRRELIASRGKLNLSINANGVTIESESVKPKKLLRNISTAR